MLLELVTILSVFVNITVGGVVLFNYFKIKNILYKIKMNVEELLNINVHDLPKDKDVGSPTRLVPSCTDLDVEGDTKRERLSAIIAGGRGKQYIGRDLQISDIDAMTNEEVNKLYCRYEARLGASMTKTLGNSFINLYVMGVSNYFNVTNPPKLIEDLEEDPFINHALTTACCELYYKYGMYLAPFTAMLTTAKNIDFSTGSEICKNKNKNENENIKEDE